MTLKALLGKKLIKKELKAVPSSFDIIGSKDKAVAIIEIPEKLRKKRKIIANALMKKHKNVKSVLDKKSPRKGVYRTRDYEFIAGQKNTEVTHIESGCRFLLDPRKVYFSPREGTERLRIAEKVKSKEKVMIFFAGVGPFALVIGKKANPKHIIGIEINPRAIEYFKKNVILNKLKNIDVILGDVREKSKLYFGKCDRVIMPLPESAHEYLEQAIMCLKPKGICHYYCFCKENEVSKEKNIIRARARMLKKRVKFIDVKKVLQWGPGIWKTRIDFEVY